MAGFAFGRGSAGIELTRISTWVLEQMVLAARVWAVRGVRGPGRRGWGRGLEWVRVQELVQIPQQLE